MSLSVLLLRPSCSGLFFFWDKSHVGAGTMAPSPTRFSPCLILGVKIHHENSAVLRAKSGCFSGCCGFTTKELPNLGEINSPWLPWFSHDSPMASGNGNQCLWPMAGGPRWVIYHEIPLYKSQFCVFSDAIHRVGKDHHLPQEVIFANWPIPCCLAKQHGTVRHYCHLLPFEGNIYI